MRIIDVLLAVPGILLAIGIVAWLGHGDVTVGRYYFDTISIMLHLRAIEGLSGRKQVMRAVGSGSSGNNRLPVTRGHL